MQAPEDAANYFRLARAAEAIGRDQVALEMYGKAIEKATASDSDRRPAAGGDSPRSKVPAAVAPGGAGAEGRASGMRPPAELDAAGSVARTRRRAVAGPALAG